ncbi:hypothetical protein HYS31_02360 [Candidatus Woesearchaeota archaeon]|nr:hypothetical protein [Candidatus Woesearchaeota archaeon]
MTSNKKQLLKPLLLLSALLLVSSIALAIPNSITLQGKLTNTAGTPQQGTFNFTFRIYDAYTSGSLLWLSPNNSISTDANGIYDIVLAGVNLSFADAYFLSVEVNADGESSPRVNLTSSPYSFRANVSESLNPNASYFVNNLSVRGNATIGAGSTFLEVSTQTFNLTTIGAISLASNITLGDQARFRLGQVIDNLVSGWLRLTGSLNVTGDVQVSGTISAVNITTTNLSVVHLPLGWTNLTGYPSACPSGQFVTTIDDAITCATPSPSSGGGWTDDGSLIRLVTHTDNVAIGTNFSGEKLTVNGSFRIDNSSGSSVFFANASNQKIGIGTTLPSDTLTVIGSVVALGSLNATFINATEIRQGTNLVQTINAVYNLGNFTSNLNAQNSSLWNRSSSNVYLKFIDDLVGIGTITPDNRLTIRGTDADANLAQPGLLHLNMTDSYNRSVTNLITLDHGLNNPANSTGGIGIGILFRAVNNDSELVNVSFINATLVNAVNGSEASALSFYTRAANGLLTPKIVLNGTDVFIAPEGSGDTYINPNGGNVGINTTVPAQTFTVQGTANITSSSTQLLIDSNGDVIVNLKG